MHYMLLWLRKHWLVWSGLLFNATASFSKKCPSSPCTICCFDYANTDWYDRACSSMLLSSFSKKCPSSPCTICCFDYANTDWYDRTCSSMLPSRFSKKCPSSPCTICCFDYANTDWYDRTCSSMLPSSFSKRMSVLPMHYMLFWLRKHWLVWSDLLFNATVQLY